MSAAGALASLTKGFTPEQLLMMKDQNHDAEVYTVSVIFSVLAILAVAVRVSSRHMKSVAFGIDDALVVIAMIIFLAQTVFICVGVHLYGLGRHLWALQPAQFVGFEKVRPGSSSAISVFPIVMKFTRTKPFSQQLWYTVGTLQCTGLLLTKISVLMLFHRIFIIPVFRLLLKIIGVVMLLWWVGTILADTLICIPIAANWDPTISAHCGNKQSLAIVPPIPWIVTDLIILLMPLPMVWKLQLPRLQKVGLACLFLLGGFAMVASCVRYSTLFYKHDDVTFYIIPATIWTIIEADVTIISACLIVSRPWLMKLYPSKLISTIRERRSSRKSASSSNDRKWPILSSFKKLGDRPPAVPTQSLGTRFEFDVEKGMSTDSGSSGGGRF
ncbi:hypothetical protein MMC21_006970 [Puttea exsequens]|nr:hypothetical protein [Puttea exsequens]